jgi:uncharacterized membrane protein YfcA
LIEWNINSPVNASYAYGLIAWAICVALLGTLLFQSLSAVSMFTTVVCCLYVIVVWMFIRRDHAPIKQRALSLVIGGNIMAVGMPCATLVSYTIYHIYHSHYELFNAIV